nr:RNA-directed DNA polymerase, eukaryota [Tanacetum cinerariifolium]
MQDSNLRLRDKPHSFFAPEGKPPLRGLNSRPLACDVFIPFKRSKSGKRFAFVRFIKFTELIQATSSFENNERIVWISIEGLLIKAWTPNTFHKIASLWGEYVEWEDADLKSLSCKHLCLKTNMKVIINERQKVIIHDKLYWIHVKELDAWFPNFQEDDQDDLSSDGESQEGDVANKDDNNESHVRRVSESSFMHENDTAHKDVNSCKKGEVGSHSEDPFNIYGILDEQKNNLQALKIVIKAWSKEANKRSNDRKINIQQNISEVDKLIDQGKSNDEILIKRITLLNDLQELNNRNAMEISQKANIRWSIEGDENSKYFYGIMNKKRSQLAIRGTLANEEWISEPHRYWTTIDDDVFQAVRDFFVNGHFPRGCNSSFIALIPKIQDAKFVKDFRPISLIGSVYKIIAKILANRLCVVLTYLISDVQSDFVANHQILDGPFILNELLSWCKFKKLNDMGFKVNFEKAFDSMKWDYLDETLKDFGFGSKWRNWISSCLNNAMGSVLVNGSPTLEFQFHKGLKQGISLNDSFKIPHLFYADDVVFIGEWNNNNIQTLLNVLRYFYLASGLKINLHKSKLMGIGVSSNVVAAAASLIGCSILTATFSYLGVKVGSNMRPLFLLKSVLTSISLYHMSIFKVPIGVLNHLESIRRNFFYGVDGSDRKLAWIGWNMVLTSKKNGGLGVSSFFAHNRALLFKWFWRFLTYGSSLWTRFIKAIFGNKEALDTHKLIPRRSPWQDVILAIHSLQSKGVNLMDFIQKKVGNGENTSFWDDSWLGEVALKENYDLLCSKVTDLVLPNVSDRWCWSLEGSQEFSVKSSHILIDNTILPKADVPTRWLRVVPIKVNVHAWRVCLDKLPTRANLSHRGMDIPSIACPLCKDIDVYLRPLIDDQKVLWALKGVETIDVATGQNFNMRAMVLRTINDFPDRSSLSGWSGKGYKVGKPIIELCSFFKQICSATLMEDDMLKAKSKVVDILCNLEVIYPPAFFDIMIHLVIHLPLEALKGRPIRPRWMFSFERFMKKLKGYVRNKAKSEGSIVKGYVAEEALTFSSHYFRDVTTKFDRPDQLKKVIWYVLYNSPEINMYRSQFKSKFPNKDMKEAFLDWFGSQIRQRHVDNDLGVITTNKLFALACGPTPTPISVNSCVVNGVRFVMHSYDKCCTTQNNGIGLPDGKDIEMYYDQFHEILEFLYLSFKVVLFLVKWFYTSNEGRKVKHLVLRNNMTQILTKEEDHDVIHFDNSSDLPLSTSLNDLDNATLHIDGQSIEVDALPYIINLDEDDDINDDEDAIPHDLADSDDEDLVNVYDDDGVDMSADVARSHDGDGGGNDRPPTHHIRTGCGGCFANRVLDRYQCGHPAEPKASLKAAHWVINPNIETYDVERIKPRCPQNIAWQIGMPTLPFGMIPGNKPGPLKITKTRLCVVLPYLISDVQSAFVANHQILDGPFILNELLSWCKFKKQNGMSFKVEFEKAFDSMKWDYLDETLKAFGFSSKWRLKINLYESKLMRIGVSSNIVAAAVFLIGCSILTAPFNYLGVNVGSNMSKITSWDDVMSKVSSRLSKWKLKHLSISGCLSLLISVLTLILLYHMSIFKVLIGVLNHLESICWNFFYGVDCSDRKLAWIGWNMVLTSKKNSDGELSNSGVPVVDPYLFCDVHCVNGYSLEMRTEIYTVLSRRATYVLIPPPPPPPQCTHNSGDVKKLKKKNKYLTKQVNLMIKPFRSDDKFLQMLNQYKSTPKFGNGSGSSGCGDDEMVGDEDGGEDEDDEKDGDMSPEIGIPNDKSPEKA